MTSIDALKFPANPHKYSIFLTNILTKSGALTKP